MKILLVTEDFFPKPGGVARFLHNLCVHSQTQTSVLTTEMEETDSEHFDDCQPYRICRIHLPARLGFLSLLTSAYRQVARLRPDLIFWGHAPWVAVVGRWLKVWFGKPMAILVHGTELNMALQSNWFSRWMVLFALRGADIVFANSRDTSRRVQNLGVHVDKISILNPGVDIERFHVNVNVSDLIRRYDLSDKKVLLTVSRLVPKKNHVAVLHALPDVLTKVPNVIYLIVGDGSERKNLQRLSHELGLREHIIFIPHTTGQDLVKLYNICDLFIMVSKIAQTENLVGSPIDVESFGIAFIEAGACGKPVVGGLSGGIADSVVNGETGLLVDPDDEYAIADAIIRLLSDKELARRFGDNGRRRAVEELSWDKVANRFDHALMTCLNNYRKSII